MMPADELYQVKSTSAIHDSTRHRKSKAKKFHFSSFVSLMQQDIKHRQGKLTFFPLHTPVHHRAAKQLYQRRGALSCGVATLTGTVHLKDFCKEEMTKSINPSLDELATTITMPCKGRK